MKKQKIRFFYDIVCPYAYLASTQIDRLEKYADVEWVPMLLGGIFKYLQAPQVPALQMSKGKAMMNELDLYRWADQWQVPFQFSPHHPQRSVECQRLLCMVEGDQRRAMSQRLYQAYWQDGMIINEDLLADICRSFDLPENLWQTEEAKQKLIASTEIAYRLGVFGAPTFEINGELFWGQDRIDLMMDRYFKHLTQRGGHWENHSQHKNTLIFYHDFSSPFSYLASTQIKKLAQANGVHLIYRPILLGALFKQIQTPDVPFLAMNASKQKYILKDLTDWAKFWNVPFYFNAHFPIRTPQLLRLSIIEPRLIDEIYHAIWVENRSFQNDQAIADFLAEKSKIYDFDVQILLSQMSQDEVKMQLRENTSQAQNLDVFGVPTIEVLDLEENQRLWQQRITQKSKIEEKSLLFWGQDRLIMLDHFLKQN
jgi:2-hydroxychromene-2-carboxylate isomerase